jgi:predicted TIM-barrel fold metal-dependent hydrolase
MSPNLEDGPPYAGAEPLFALAKHPNIYLKLSSVIVRQTRAGNATPKSFLARVVNEFGAQRIAWGSNFPASPGSLKEIVTDNLQAVEWLAEEDKEWIFNRTASQLYPALA